MDFTKRLVLLTLMVTVAFASSAVAAKMDGTIKLGGVIVEKETGDLSAMQETYNIYEGFSASQIKLNGALSPQTYFALSLNDINLDSRKSDFEFWVPGRFRFFTRYDEHRQVFDPGRVVDSRRRNLRLGTWVTPLEWFTLSADYDRQAREGTGLAFPAGAGNWPGKGYDDALQTGRVEGELRKGQRALAVAYDFSEYSDCGFDIGDRFGYIVSGRLRTPDYFVPKVIHLLRAGYGKRALSNSDQDYTLQNFQYTGIASPVQEFQLKYNFYASRIDDKSTRLKTDNFRNNLDVSYFYPRGVVFGGYGYEMNDDERSLTSNHTYRVGGSLRGPRKLAAKIEYANRSKKDEEKLTLLKDSETASFLAKLQVSPVNDFTIGASYKDRQRDFPDIDVESDGQSANVCGRYSYNGWGSTGAEYTYANDEYDNRIGGFDTESHIITSRISLDRIENLKLGGGVTYLDVGRDLDIEKSILFVEAAYELFDDYHVEIKYNVYNYDDYILVDRYYTANVVWINVAYNFDLKKE